MPDLDELRADLAAEQAELDVLVASLSEKAWLTPTPAEGWSVKDQISHLAFFEEQARLAASDPAKFAAGLNDLASDGGRLIDGPVTEGRRIPGSSVLRWWRAARAAALDALAEVPGGTRIPWFGPPMSIASFISARIMETWAHGQDVEDALGRPRAVTDRLRHIAFLGVRARSYSFEMNGLPAPQDEVRVELTGPGGSTWTWGTSGSERVAGSLRDFCLVVTRRRHVEDTSLQVEGPSAAAWMRIAQAFAGPGGSGRKPGQFRTT